jgi:hypothetical protein
MSIYNTRGKYLSVVIRVSHQERAGMAIPQHFENGKDDIVDITEAACFATFGVMESSRPVDGDVC